jgi:pyruvate formate lyase activating enzyme
MDRRNFLKTVAGGACIGTLADAAWPFSNRPGSPWMPGFGPAAVRADTNNYLHEASYYNKLEHKEIQCVLCPRKCVVGDRERGYCGVRENKDGVYYTLVYNRPCSMHTDPIEKKPLFHFLPTTRAFSLATAGCNMNCKFCQNWEISQVRPEQVRSRRMTPADCVEKARTTGARSIAYTYTEPVIFLEYMHDIAAHARKHKIRNVMISAGYVEEKPLSDLLPLMDAVKIDLKAFSDDYYRNVCRGRLDPVLHALKTIRKQGVWLEILYLVLPTMNDDPKEIEPMCAWIREELGPEVPIHFARFHPTYLMKNLPSTPVDTLERLHRTALDQGLLFPYVGNVPGHPAESTYCPHCKVRLIHRTGYNVRVEALKNGKCSTCGMDIPGVWAG